MGGDIICVVEKKEGKEKKKEKKRKGKKEERGENWKKEKKRKRKRKKYQGQLPDPQKPSYYFNRSNFDYLRNIPKNSQK